MTSGPEPPAPEHDRVAVTPTADSARVSTEPYESLEEETASCREAWSLAAAYNLRLIYYVWLLFRCMDTLSYGPFFDTYLSELAGGGAVFVGWVESINSATQVAIALPLGMCADRHSRSSVMRANAALGVLACLCYVPSVLLGSKPGLILCVVAYAVYSRSYGGTMDMMMADAVTKETSTHVATRKTQLGTMGAALGPLLQMVLAASGAFSDGDSSSSWGLGEIRGLVLCGWLLFPFIAPAQCRFKDMPLRPPPSEPTTSSTQANASNGRAAQPPSQEGSSDRSSELLQRPAVGTPATAERPWWLVPVLLEAFRLVFLLCAGMTTRYFALLFKNLFKLSPSAVALLFAVSPLLQTAALQAVPHIIDRLGRPRAALVLHVLSSGALLLLAVARGPVSAALAFFAYQSLTKVMDIPIYSMVLVSVRPEHRGKFFHLLSIKPLTFGASALIGGFIVDAYGYRAVVATTGATLVLLPTPLLLAVVWLLPHP